MTGLLLALLAVAAPAPPPAAATRVQRGATAAALKAAGMSDAGLQVLRQHSAPDPDAKAVLDRRQAIRDQLATAAEATPFDTDGFAALLRESATLENNARLRAQERIVGTLKALSPADRPIFARAIFNRARPPAPGETTPPPR